MGLICGVDEEKAKTVICVHDLDLGLIFVPIEGESVEVERRVCVEEFGVGGAGEVGAGGVGCQARFGFRDWDGDGEELEGGVFPNFSI